MILVLHPDGGVRQALVQAVGAARPGDRVVAGAAVGRGIDLARDHGVSAAVVDLDGGAGVGAIVPLVGEPGRRLCPVVAVTADRDPARMLEAEEAGVTAFVHLPVDASCLGAVLAAVVEGREA